MSWFLERTCDRRCLLDAPFGRRCGGIGRLALSVPMTREQAVFVSRGLQTPRLFGACYMVFFVRRRFPTPGLRLLWRNRGLWGFRGCLCVKKTCFFLVLCFWRVSFVARGF